MAYMGRKQRDDLGMNERTSRTFSNAYHDTKVTELLQGRPAFPLPFLFVKQTEQAVKAILTGQWSIQQALAIHLPPLSSFSRHTPAPKGAR